jgi:hypothetical protein
MEEAWIQVLKRWPQEIPREGIIVTSFGESIEFISYMLLGTVLLLERSKPDMQNARRVMVQLGDVAMIKVTNPIDIERFTTFGFQVPTMAGT